MRKLFVVAIIIIETLWCNVSMAQDDDAYLTATAGVPVPKMQWDQVHHQTSATFSGGGLNASLPGTGIVIGNIFHTTGAGKYYCEVTCNYPVETMIGFIGSTYSAGNLNHFSGTDAVGWAVELYSSGAIWHNGSSTHSGMTGTYESTGYTYLFAWDAGAGNMYVGVYYAGAAYWYNYSGGSTSFASASPLNASAVSGSFTIAVGFGGGGTETYVLNSGQSAYVATPPSGYVNW